MGWIGSNNLRSDLGRVFASIATALMLSCIARFGIHLKQRYFTRHPEAAPSVLLLLMLAAEVADLGPQTDALAMLPDVVVELLAEDNDEPIPTNGEALATLLVDEASKVVKKLRRANIWVVIEGVFVVGMTLLFAVLIAWPHTMVAALADFTALVAFGLLSMTLVDAAENAGHPRGSEFERCKDLVVRLDGIIARGEPMSWARMLRRVPLTTATQHVSSFVLAITVLFGALVGGELGLKSGNGVQYVAHVIAEHTGNGKPAIKPTPKMSHGPTSPPSSGGSPHPGPSHTKSPPPSTPALSPYERLCGQSVVPGENAHGAVRARLHDMWLASTANQPTPSAESSTATGPLHVGADIAGCAQLAETEPGHRHVWFVEGVCRQGLLCAIGIVAPGYIPSLILGKRLANFALRAIERGVLHGATPREDVGRGDLYLIDVGHGTDAFVRTNKGDGYVRLPAELTDLWKLEMQNARGWTWPQKSHGQRSHYVFKSLGGAVMTHARCKTRTCSMTIDGVNGSVTHLTRVSYEDIATYAPAPESK
jgi:hypothetical protein